MSADTFLGRLGNREGVNVAKVEVSWWDEDTDAEGHGFYVVHAVGDEPEIVEMGEDGTIYAVFEARVHGAMQAKVEAGKFTAWEIDDISAI